MNRCQLVLFTVAGIFGIGGALANTSRLKLNTKEIYAERTGRTGTYIYTNKRLHNAPFGACEDNDESSACTFSSTATAGYFNAHNANVFPEINSNPATGVIVNYINLHKIYRSVSKNSK